MSKNKTIFTVKIISCSNENFWYSDKIDSVFKVKKIGCQLKVENSCKLILEKDAEEIK